MLCKALRRASNVVIIKIELTTFIITIKLSVPINAYKKHVVAVICIVFNEVIMLLAGGNVLSFE